MKKFTRYLIIGGLFLLTASFSLSSHSVVEDWGFFGHRLINRMAVFTLPPEMISIFKGHIEYLAEHAVDPDKRRYANPYEGVRHFIDIDYWGEPPFDNLPREWGEALAKFTVLKAVTEEDTVEIFNFPISKSFHVSTVSLYLPDGDRIEIKKWDYVKAFRKFFLSQYYTEEWRVDLNEFLKYLDLAPRAHSYIILAEDRLSPLGILPYTLQQWQHKLTKAFESRDISRVLYYASDLGHYVADAHVPLHTTENYDGVLTGQKGLHAFWESRIPELFADTEFDFFVGKAEYIEDKRDFFWDIVLTSHSYVDSVLLIEKRLRKSWDEGAIYCYDERLGRIIRTQCEEYAAAYNIAMDNMVEKRMRESIKAIGSAWYTAWVDAGQPQLSEISDTLYHYMRDEDHISSPGKFYVRPHE